MSMLAGTRRLSWAWSFAALHTSSRSSVRFHLSYNEAPLTQPRHSSSECSCYRSVLESSSPTLHPRSWIRIVRKKLISRLSSLGRGSSLIRNRPRLALCLFSMGLSMAFKISGVALRQNKFRVWRKDFWEAAKPEKLREKGIIVDWTDNNVRDVSRAVSMLFHPSLCCFRNLRY